jgi:hypothetical protein
LLRAPPKAKAITADGPAKPQLALSDDRPSPRSKDPR